MIDYIENRYIDLFQQNLDSVLSFNNPEPLNDIISSEPNHIWDGVMSIFLQKDLDKRILLGRACHIQPIFGPKAPLVGD